MLLIAYASDVDVACAALAIQCQSATESQDAFNSIVSMPKLHREVKVTSAVADLKKQSRFLTMQAGGVAGSPEVRNPRLTRNTTLGIGKTAQPIGGRG